MPPAPHWRRRFACALLACAGAAFGQAAPGANPALRDNSSTIHLRASCGDLYAGGEALIDGQPLRDQQGRPANLALARYAR